MINIFIKRFREVYCTRLTVLPPPFKLTGVFIVVWFLKTVLLRKKSTKRFGRWIAFLRRHIAYGTVVFLFLSHPVQCTIIHSACNDTNQGEHINCTLTYCTLTYRQS